MGFVRGRVRIYATRGVTALGTLGEPMHLRMFRRRCPHGRRRHASRAALSLSRCRCGRTSRVRRRRALAERAVPTADGDRDDALELGLVQVGDCEASPAKLTLQVLKRVRAESCRVELAHDLLRSRVHRCGRRTRCLRRPRNNGGADCAAHGGGERGGGGGGRSRPRRNEPRGVGAGFCGIAERGRWATGRFHADDVRMELRIDLRYVERKHAEQLPDR